MRFCLDIFFHLFCGDFFLPHPIIILRCYITLLALHLFSSFPPIFSCWSFLRCCQHWQWCIFGSLYFLPLKLLLHSSFSVFIWEDLFLCFKIVHWVTEWSIFCWAILILGLCRKLEAGAKQCIRRFSILVTRTWYIALTLRAHKQQKASERNISAPAGTVLSCFS